MKTLYVSEDGKKFISKEKCLQYEDELRIKQAEERKKWTERMAKYMEIIKLIDQYNNDYDECFIISTRDFGSVSELFG